MADGAGLPSVAVLAVLAHEPSREARHDDEILAPEDLHPLEGRVRAWRIISSRPT
jgi:hypothetical protein